MKARSLDLGNDLICEHPEHTVPIPATIVIETQYGVVEYMCRDHVKEFRKKLKQVIRNER